ncbi:hypothetical protein HED50_18415 [Ochrobactrum oryzae]|nr:hypothetical protein [Brucella oryzae]
MAISCALVLENQHFRTRMPLLIQALNEAGDRFETTAVNIRPANYLKSGPPHAAWINIS